MYKIALLFCAQALIQSTSARCVGGPFADGFWGGYGLGRFSGGYGCGDFAVGALAASNGGGLMVTSSSPIAPIGVSMTSENAYEGLLNVCGAIPFLGAVALEGCLPTVGTSTVRYTCGNGAIGITEEDVAPAYGFAGYGDFGYDGYGFAGPYVYDGYYGAGFGGYGCDGYGFAGPYDGYYGAGFGGYGCDGYGFDGPYDGYYGAGCGGWRGGWW